MRGYEWAIYSFNDLCAFTRQIQFFDVITVQLAIEMLQQISFVSIENILQLLNLKLSGND